MCNYDTLYHVVNEEEKPTTIDVFDDCSYVLYGQDLYDNQDELMHSSFQDDCEEKVSDFQFSEIFPSQPIFDEYSDDNLDILEPDVFMVTESDQQIREGIQLLIYEQPELVHGNYASEGSMEEEDQPVDYHDDIVVVPEISEQNQDDFIAFDYDNADLGHTFFSTDQMECSLTSGTNITEEQNFFLYQLKMQHNWHDPVVVYMDMAEDFRSSFLFAAPHEHKIGITYGEDIKQEVINSKISSQLYPDLQKVVYDIHTSEVEVNIEQQVEVNVFGYQSTSFFYDPVDFYMESCFSEDFSLAKFRIKEDGGCKYVLQVKILLHIMKFSLILFCIQGVFTVAGCYHGFIGSMISHD
jgi:hypothetical protein